MRILFICYDFPPKLGGQARLGELIANALRAEADVTVVTSAKIEPRDRQTLAILRSTQPVTFNAITLAQKVGRGFDLVVAGDSDLSGRIAARYCLLTGLRMIQLCHGLDLNTLQRRSAAGAIDRMLARRSLCVIANSSFTMAEAQRAFAPRAIRVIHPGVKIPDPAPAAEVPSARPARLLTVARLVRRKGHDVVLHALSGLDEDVAYEIVGEGPERTPLEALARELGLEDRVRFLGALPDRELRERYARCTAFVMTPREIALSCGKDYEGFGMVYLEANAHGRPVIASRSGGVPDAVSDGRSGMLVEPENPQALRDALRTLLSDKALHARLSQGARDWAQRFDHRIKGRDYAEAVRDAAERVASSRR